MDPRISLQSNKINKIFWTGLQCPKYAEKLEAKHKEIVASKPTINPFFLGMKNNLSEGINSPRRVGLTINLAIIFLFFFIL